jgi:hypothetical protein
MDALRAYIASRAPGMGADDVAAGADALLALCLDRPGGYATDPAHRAVERALVRVWLAPTAPHAVAYLEALRPVLRASLALERRRAPAPAAAPLDPPARVGPYRVDGYLGRGGDGTAYRAVDPATGLVVTVKLPALGDVAVAQRLGDEWHPHLLRTWRFGPPDEQTPAFWVAREHADGTFADAVARRGGRPLDRAEALAVFATCCGVVAWLHARRVYRWSAHPGNVYRVGGRWKVGDLGRCAMFVAPDDPLLAEVRRSMLQAAGADGPDAEGTADFFLRFWHWGHPTSAGFYPHDPERERRHRMDDCAMLGGLLCALLTGRRWGWFARAIEARPCCSAAYALTGRKPADAALSVVLNRCWRGDAGGAPLLANGGREDQTVYDDALALLADVASVLESPLPPEPLGHEPGVADDPEWPCSRRA